MELHESLLQLQRDAPSVSRSPKNQRLVNPASKHKIIYALPDCKTGPTLVVAESKEEFVSLEVIVGDNKFEEKEFNIPSQLLGGHGELKSSSANVDIQAAESEKIFATERDPDLMRRLLRYFMDSTRNMKGSLEKQSTNSPSERKPEKKIGYPVKRCQTMVSTSKGSGKSKTVKKNQSASGPSETQNGAPSDPLLGTSWEGIVDEDFEGGFIITVNVNGTNMRGVVFNGPGLGVQPESAP